MTTAGVEPDHIVEGSGDTRAAGVADRVPALYLADIRHHRSSPREHGFRYGTLLWLIDVDRPPRLPAGLRWMARFDPADHLDIRAELAGHSLRASQILMLAHARTLGYGFDPATFYWCYDAGRLVATVVEVHNTYGGRHAYVLEPGAAPSTVPKSLFVSPFHPPHGEYRMRISDPGDEIRAVISYRHDDARPFVARLVARRRPATPVGLARAWVRYPWAPLRVSALIRWEALRLAGRRIPVHHR